MDSSGEGAQRKRRTPETRTHSTTSAHLGRIVSFGLIAIGGSLLQIWILLLALSAINRPVTSGVIFGQGGLFFFATSMVFTSLAALLASGPVRFGTADFNITLLIVGPITLLVAVVYSSVLSGPMGTDANPFEAHRSAQLACAFAAVAYAFFVAQKTEIFRRGGND